MGIEMLQANFCGIIPVPIQTQQCDGSKLIGCGRNGVLKPPNMKMHKVLIRLDFIQH